MQLLLSQRPYCVDEYNPEYDYYFVGNKYACLIVLFVAGLATNIFS